MQHNEKDQENGTSCKPRSVFRDLEILRRENRGTDLMDDAENRTVASIHVRSKVQQEESWRVVESLHPPVSLSLQICNRVNLISGNRQGRLRSSLGLLRLAATRNIKDRIWSILLDHIRRVDHVELGCSVLEGTQVHCDKSTSLCRAKRSSEA